MQTFKCPKCGREIIFYKVTNGYMGECCGRLYFRPSPIAVACDNEDGENDPM